MSLVLLALAACRPTKYLKDNETLLVKNSYKMHSDQKISTLDDKLKLDNELFTLYKQKPNRKILGISRAWIYFKLAPRDQKSGMVKALNRFAELPAIVDTALCSATVRNINNYYYNKGYLNNTVSYELIHKSKRKSEVRYHIQTKKLFTIDSLQYQCADTSILSILLQNKSASHLAKNGPIDNSIFLKEKLRISELLQNNGYAEFNPLYIGSLSLDTSRAMNIVGLKISLPQDRVEHKKFAIKSVNVYHNITASENQWLWNRGLIDSIHFFDRSRAESVNPEFLKHKILTRPGQNYNKSEITNSYNNLNKLGLYRFINIETQIDTSDHLAINLNYYLNLNKKWVFDAGADLNYTTLKSVGANLFGVTGNIVLKNRNLLGNAEVFQTGLQIGTEINLLGIRNYSSLTANFQNTLVLPQFYDVTGSYGLLQQIRSLVHKRYNKEPQTFTNFSLGVDYVFLANTYQYFALNSQIGYDINNKQNQRLSAHTFNVSYYLPRSFAAFDSLFRINEFLRRSFQGNRLFTSFVFNDLNYYKQTKVNSFYTKSLYTSLEFSGLEIQIANSIYNLFSSRNLDFKLRNIEFSKFIRFDIDHRWYFSYSDNSSLVLRATSGVIFPFGTSVASPYIRQFYMGGPQSMRGWSIRELGPGGELPPNVASNLSFFSAADMKLETNIEYRSNLFWRFKWAAFMDMGNLWLLPKSSREDKIGEISKTFYKQLAISAGLGLRMDVTFAIIRMDYGIKLRNPYKNEETKSYWLYGAKNPVSLTKIYKNSNLHLAINYPF
ncbi:MAG TPA: BamA/TamA family outer membrane protein [Saprospiraceae bacterium]|nr:BamA/TamA family outer membrane protein [Saprospiraceae bacterium]